MNYLNLKITFILLSLFISSLSFAQETPKNSVSNEISATHDFVDAVVNKVDGQMRGNSIQSHDYDQVKASFRAKIRLELTQFEAQMNHSIFQPLSAYVDEYNRVYRDPSRSASEKQAQLSAKLTMLKGLMGLYQQQYDEYLAALYSIEPSLRVKEILYEASPVRIKDQYSCLAFLSVVKRQALFEDGSSESLPDATTRACNHTKKEVLEQTERYIIGYKGDKTYASFQPTSTHAYQVLKSTCASSSPEGIPSQYCINSSIADHLEYFLSIQSALDRKIVVTLADGKQIQLTPITDQLHNLTIRSLQSIQLDSEFRSYPFTN